MTITTNILNISKLTGNHLITKTHSLRHASGHWTCLMTFNLTQALLVSDRDIVFFNRGSAEHKAYAELNQETGTSTRSSPTYLDPPAGG